MNKLFFQSLLGTTVTGAIILTANIAQADFSLKEEGATSKNNLIALQFELPDDAVPNTSVGGGVRGDVQFALPGESSTPNTSVGGGVRGDVEFALPGKDATPDTSVGGGVRGTQIPLTAIVPNTKHGRTISARPTIFAYLPPIGAQEVFFSIQDEEGNSHYQTMLKVPASGGVISVTLPESAAELELSKNYLWYFAPIEPGGILKPDNYAVTGWVTRVETDINQQDLAASPVKLATEYASAGIWYDTLEVLVEAQKSDPNNTTFSSEWHDLLEQIELEDIASQPIAVVSPF